jgi:predicted glycoside hydrolase/deacetylase ChbG (UPF0249 family)
VRYLIFNADDFGASRGINRGIVEAHAEGVITSTSLMVNMRATAEAIELARDHPHLDVGIHVNFTNEGENPVVDVSDVAACEGELEAQFELFVRLLGRLPTHIDSQHNIHFRKHLLPLFTKLADRYGLPLRGRGRARYFGNFYGQWDGESHPEHVSVDSLCQMLASLEDSVAEIGCHPGYQDPDFETVYSAEREVELQTLRSSRLTAFLREAGFRTIGFRDLGAL